MDQKAARVPDHTNLMITDAVGILLLVPPTRAAVRRTLVEAFRRPMQGGGTVVLDGEWSRKGEPPAGGTGRDALDD
jgi:UPF0716 family protein affecting phage T7 exclusion